MFSRTSFINTLEKATSHYHLEPDWKSIIAVSDCIRQGEVEPKFALSMIKKKLFASSLHVTNFALLVLESCVKNCGSNFHNEVATKSFMEDLRELVKTCSSEKIKDKILELIQTWAYAFRKQQQIYRPVQDMLNLLKVEGYKFPVFKEPDAMFTANVAPEWADGDCCNRCRVSFTMIERKHHCRHCGQVFCYKCSSKQSIIPKFGFEKEVRVCEDCYETLNNTSVKNISSIKPIVNGSSNQTNTSLPNKTSTASVKSKEELQEEEELQIAIALSKSEAEHKEKLKNKFISNYSNEDFEDYKFETNANIKPSSPPIDHSFNKFTNKTYWDNKTIQDNKTQNETKPSAPQQNIVKNQPRQVDLTQNTTIFPLNHSSEEENIDYFQKNLKSILEIFVTRMNSNKNRGRPINNDSAVQSMFLNITNMHSQLLKYIQQQDDMRNKYESLQDKLSQAKDARAALDSLRDEYSEKLRRQAEEAEILRQQQMAYKLDNMRKKKQEYLHYQRQIALQRVQEQEREMKMRLEQKYNQWNTIPNNNSVIQSPSTNLPTTGPNLTQQPIVYPNVVYPNTSFPSANYESTNRILPQIIHQETLPQQQNLPMNLPSQTVNNQNIVNNQIMNIPTTDTNNSNVQSVPNPHYSEQIYTPGVYNVQNINNLHNVYSPSQVPYVNQDSNLTQQPEINSPQVPAQEEAPLIQFD